VFEGLLCKAGAWKKRVYVLLLDAIGMRWNGWRG